MDGFVHKAFSVSHATSFDEVSASLHRTLHPALDAVLSRKHVLSMRMEPVIIPNPWRNALAMMCGLPRMKCSAGRSHGFWVYLRVILLLQVIMLDADNTPLKNPEVLFESREYQAGGNLYWPDWWDAQGWLRPAAYTLFGITPPWMLEGGEGFRTAESGQMVLHRCCPSLLAGKLWQQWYLMPFCLLWKCARSMLAADPLPPKLHSSASQELSLFLFEFPS